MLRLPTFLLAMLLLFLPPLARAGEAADVTAGVESSGDDLLDGYNRIVFAVNRAVYTFLGMTFGGGDAAPEAPPPPAPPSHGPGLVIANLINEPLTALSSLVVGDLPTAWKAVQRFGINTTAGVFGWWDRASEWGYAPEPADVGLALCRWGVGEGGYVMLPFIGPRTWRDGAADVVLVNALLWTTTAAVFSSGFSWQTILIAESIEVSADIVATRQIDPRAKALRFDDYEKQRADYLAERRQRCAGHREVAVAEVRAAAR